jgi:signal transduction histidine kinase
MRHMIVAVLVVVVINAQLTWWIVFVLRVNRESLDLERETLLAAGRMQAARVAAELATARTALDAALLMGDEPGRSPVPAPFVGWRASFSNKECTAANLNSSGVIELSVESGLTCLTGVLASEWRQRVLDVGEDFEVVAGDDADRAGVELEAPFSNLQVQPRAEVWEALLDTYRRRIVMLVSEGAFFAVLLFVLMGLLWKSFRREVELERQHRNFLSAVTHELKSPLAAMRLALETVLAGRAKGEAARNFLVNALDDTDRLEDLVQKVLEATRFGEGRPEYHFRKTDLSGLVEDAVDIFTRRALAAGAVVESEIAPDVHAEIDPEAIAIVVSNLLENAVKYGGKPAAVTVALDFDGKRAVLEVTDNGTGIPEGDRAFVFGRFFRGGDEMTRTTNGTGLGLYLVQQIVEAHRGRVEIASTGPDGTVLRATLPGFEM